MLMLLGLLAAGLVAFAIALCRHCSDPGATACAPTKQRLITHSRPRQPPFVVANVPIRCEAVVTFSAP